MFKKSEFVCCDHGARALRDFPPPEQKPGISLAHPLNLAINYSGLSVFISCISCNISYFFNNLNISLKIFLLWVCCVVKFLRSVIVPMKLKDVTPWKESYDQPRQHIKKQRRYFANKGPSSQGYAFSSGHVWMWELYYKESWVLKNWCFWTVVLEKTLESPLDCKEIQPVNPKGNQSWVFIGRTDGEAETPITLATWCEKLTHLKRPWCWERLRAGGEEWGWDRRRWDDWMASPTRWTWVWMNSRSGWWTGRPGVLWFMGLQRIGHD